MNFTLGAGKAVHLGSKADGYRPTIRCNGNQAGEMYTATADAVTCRKCLKLVEKAAAWNDRMAYAAGVAETQDETLSQAPETATPAVAADLTDLNLGSAVLDIIDSGDAGWVRCNDGAAAEQVALATIEKIRERIANGPSGLTLAGMTDDQLKALRDKLVTQLDEIENELSDRAARASLDTTSPIRVTIDGVNYLVGPMVASGRFGNPDFVRVHRATSRWTRANEVQSGYPTSVTGTLSRRLWDARMKHDLSVARRATAG